MDVNLEKRSEMIAYFSGATFTSDVPENILNNVREIFTKFEIEYLPDGVVVVKVPKDEMEIVEKTRYDIYQIIIAVKEKNSVLAEKLARRYGF